MISHLASLNQWLNLNNVVGEKVKRIWKNSRGKILLSTVVIV